MWARCHSPHGREWSGLRLLKGPVLVTAYSFLELSATVTTEQLCCETAASPSLVRLESACDRGRNYCIRKEPSIQKNKKKLVTAATPSTHGRRSGLHVPGREVPIIATDPSLFPPLCPLNLNQKAVYSSCIIRGLECGMPELAPG